MTAGTDPAAGGDRPDTVVACLRRHATERPDATALLMLDDDGTVHRRTFAELDARARRVASGIAARGHGGERVVLLLHTSVGYVEAFLGCLYAAALPVPLSLVVKNVHTERIGDVLVDCEPTLAVTSEPASEPAGLCRAHGVDVVGVDDLVAASDGCVPGGPIPADVAYLQYTSGSTSSPRGVVVGHDQLLHQIRILGEGIGLDDSDVVVNWLPLFHDFGLIAGLLMPLATGVPTVLMTPQSFVQRPLRWLRAVSDHRGTVTFSPNFPLDLCTSRIPDSELDHLDLGSLRTIGLGAEPIRSGTLTSFRERFARCGLRGDALRPLFGLAEATLVVTLSHTPADGPREVCVDVEAYEHGHLVRAPRPEPDTAGRVLLGHGPPLAETEVLVVDVGTGTELPSGQEGEIVVGGPTVARGYWGRPEATATTFGYHLADGRGPFLRTGDLGTWLDGQLLVTGRTKDLIIIRGRNHHPQDVELTAGRAHPACTPGLSIAVSVEDGGEEHLVVVQELRRSRPPDTDPVEVAAAIRAAVTDEHDVSVRDVVLLAPGELPVTTSGKVRRRRCREAFLDGGLCPVHVDGPSADHDVSPAGPADLLGGAAVLDWLRNRLAATTGRPAERIDPRATLGSLGLDSLAQVALTGELAAVLGRPVDPTLLYAHPTVDGFARAVAGDPPSSAPAATAAASTAAATSELAVVGLACTVPGAPSARRFWELLRDGRDAITPVPESRWHTRGRDPRTGWGGFVEEDVSTFDAAFFGIGATEAAAMDPQQRLLVTTTWRALEDAGIPPASLAGRRVGVFVGISGSDYRGLQARDGVRPGPYDGTGTASSIAANRLSYLLDVGGPSMAVDTACSSSLVALHQARQSLLAGDCETAVVAGVNVLLDAEFAESLADAGMTSHRGRCRTFDADADGYVRSEGCGVIVLRPVADAERDGDRVRGLVLGSAVDQDGRSTTLTAPNPGSQQRAMRRALAAAGVEAAAVDHVEAHGTGTPLGDPVEMAGISSVYGAPSDDPLWVSSVKTNVGHLEAAAGITGLIGVLLAMDHDTIPAHLHLRTVNPLLRLDGTRCRIPVEAVPWPRRTDRPRLAAVSSFGFGGTNAHVVLREPAGHRRSTADAPPRPGDGWRLLPLSARNDPARTAVGAELAGVVREHDRAATFADLCSVAATRRPHEPYRGAVVARSGAEAADLLTAVLDGGAVPRAHRGDGSLGGPGPTTFLFPGQGVVRPGMATALDRNHRVFRDTLACLDDVARGELGVSLLPTLACRAGELVDLLDPVLAQPAAFMVQYALADTWRAYGVEPDRVLGHSLGEFAAAAVAGILDPSDALRLVLTRARLMARTAPGAMYGVRTRHVRELLDDAGTYADRGVTVAAYNHATHVTLSGPADDVGELAERWTRRDARVVRLAITQACHSPLMDAAAAGIEVAARSVPHHAARIGIALAARGELLPAGTTDLGPAYWAEQMRGPVRFEEAVRAIDLAGNRCWVDVGPDPVLTPSARETAAPDGAWLVSGRFDDGDDRHLLDGLAEWYCRGGEVVWTSLYDADVPGPATADALDRLPVHPLRPTRHWYRAADRGAHRAARTPGLLPGDRLDIADTARTWYETALSRHDPPLIGGHRLFDEPVLPAAMTIEWMVRAVGASVGGSSGVRPSDVVLEDVAFTAVAGFPDDRSYRAQAVVTHRGADGFGVRCLTHDDGRWTDHASARACLRPTDTTASGRAHDAAAAAAGPDLGLPHGTEHDVDEHYARLRRRGLGYGDDLRNVRRLRTAVTTAVGLIELSDADTDADRYLLDPRVVDACFHVAAALVDDSVAGAPVPVGVDRVEVWRPVPHAVRCHVVRTSDSDLRFDIVLASPDGEPVATVDGLVLHPIGASTQAVRTLTPVWTADDHPDRPDRGLLGGDWLVVGTGTDDTDSWSAALRDLGARPHVARGGVAATPTADGHPPTDLAGVLVLGTTTDHDDGPDGYLDVALELFPSVRDALRRSPALPTVIVATRDGIDVGDGDGDGDVGVVGDVGDAGAGPRDPATPPPRIDRSAPASLVTILAGEHPHVRCVHVDLDAHADRADALRRAAASPTGSRLAVRAGSWWRRTVGPAAPAGFPVVRPDATYLVTGGCGALGRRTATWLAEQGATHLVLTTRTVRTEDPDWVCALRRAGTTVALRRADVTDEDAVVALLDHVAAQWPPLRGVVHAAGIVDDAVFDDLTADRYRSVVQVKARGAWFLHRHLPAGADFFVLYSSVASLLGSPGQANYILANSYLDALAEHRHALGLPATAVHWGPWAEAGLAADPETVRILAERGIRGLTAAEATAALPAAFTSARPRIGIVAMDRLPAEQPVSEDRADVPAVGALVADLAVDDPTAAESAVLDLLLEEIAVLLGWTGEERAEVRPRLGGLPLRTLGLDSLTAVRLRTRLAAVLRVVLSTEQVFDGTLVSDVARSLVDQVAARRVIDLVPAGGGAEDSEEITF